MFVIVAKYLIPKGYRGLTVFPFVLIKYALDSKNKVLVNHEKIHIRQQLELLVFPFFVWYFVEYAVRLLQYKNANLAYRNISFEREAYANEERIDYLKSRPFFSFLNYLKTNKS
ncbi:hypothetical protein [Flavobacterium sp. 5]|uniref:hypothetical protein n=1 Tax=Flavobacterium sp. 5 TaxID=2035199 RepID=UPI000C2CDE49|nr:hypothetical protein [Flavobacterium sp. 5]PKB15864.1 hypothetical protein CLU82_0966 [Flavobacterium sp. 5]